MALIDYDPGSPPRSNSTAGVISFALSLIPVASLPLALWSRSLSTGKMAILITAFALAPATAILLALTSLVRKNHRRAFALLGFILGYMALLFGIPLLRAIWDDYLIMGRPGW